MRTDDKDDVDDNDDDDDDANDEPDGNDADDDEFIFYITFHILFHFRIGSSNSIVMFV